MLSLQNHTTRSTPGDPLELYADSDLEMTDPSLSLTPREALSGILGTITIACGITLLIPQIFENIQTRSASAVSLLFLIIWAIGDITSLAGGVWAQLLPTVNALSFYYCLADVVLILQCIYYNQWVNRDIKAVEAHRNSTGTIDSIQSDEEEPLLSRSASNQRRPSIGLPGSHSRRNSTKSVKAGDEKSYFAKGSTSREWLKNACSIFAVCLLGSLAWLIAYKTHVWSPIPLPKQDNLVDNNTPLGASILGYISASLYLLARIPQIFYNWRKQSCQGLSVLFFLLSTFGNLAYGAGILCHSLDRDYVFLNLPWLIGSWGTLVEDGIIFLQFILYKEKEPRETLANINE